MIERDVKQIAMAQKSLLYFSSIDFFRNLLRGRDLSRYGTRNPHLLPCKLRFLRSAPAQLTAARDGFERSLIFIGVRS